MPRGQGRPSGEDLPSAVVDERLESLVSRREPRVLRAYPPGQKAIDIAVLIGHLRHGATGVPV